MYNRPCQIEIVVSRSVYCSLKGLRFIHFCSKQMETGTIARLNNGYGFITREGGEGPKGPNAVNVSRVG